MFALHWLEKNLDLIESAADFDDALGASEQKNSGVYHREAGRFLHELWRLNGTVVNCVGDPLDEKVESPQVVCHPPKRLPNLLTTAAKSHVHS